MGYTRTRRIAGALALWDTHRKRLLDAVGPDVFKYVEDFTGPGAAGWGVVADVEVDHADTSPVTILPAVAHDRIVKVTLSGTEAATNGPDIDIGETDTINKFSDDFAAGAWELGHGVSVTGVLSATKDLIATIAAAGDSGKLRVLVETPLAVAGFAITRVGKSQFELLDGLGGVARITTGAVENDGINAQLARESFKLTSGNTLYFGIRLKLSDATQSDFFAGLAISDADILGGVTDRIGFEKLDGATAVKAMLEKDSTETLSASLLTADTSYHILEFYVDDTGVEIFVDGASAATPATTNLPNDEELRVTLQFLAGAAAAKTMDIDWVRCIQIGRN